MIPVEHVRELRAKTIEAQLQNVPVKIAYDLMGEVERLDNIVKFDDAMIKVLRAQVRELEEELQRDEIDTLEGMFAYDKGDVDNGIHHPLMKQQIRNRFRKLPRDARRQRVQAMIDDLYLSDEARKAGGTDEKAKEFCEWFDKEFPR